MTKYEPRPAAAGIGALELLAPDGRCVATLIKQVAHQSVQIALPGRARENWPREADKERTVVRCPESDRLFFADTETLQKKMDELISDEQEDKASYFLP